MSMWFSASGSRSSKSTKGSSGAAAASSSRAAASSGGAAASSAASSFSHELPSASKEEVSVLFTGGIASAFSGDDLNRAFQHFAQVGQGGLSTKPQVVVCDGIAPSADMSLKSVPAHGIVTFRSRDAAIEALRRLDGQSKDPADPLLLVRVEAADDALGPLNMKMVRLANGHYVFTEDARARLGGDAECDALLQSVELPSGAVADGARLGAPVLEKLTAALELAPLSERVELRQKKGIQALLAKGIIELPAQRSPPDQAFQ